MTPLFMRALEAERRLVRFGYPPALLAARFFDATPIETLVAVLAAKLRADRFVPKAAHRLPFERVAAQIDEDKGYYFQRSGADNDAAIHALDVWAKNGCQHHPMWAEKEASRLEDSIINAAACYQSSSDADLLEAFWAAHYQAVALLACINSPRIVDAEECAPNWTQARKLRAAGVAAADLRFTRINLKVFRTREEGADSDRETLTGGRALHVCRQHLRVLPSGMLTWVREHERGDARFGIRIGQHTVKP